MKTWKKGAIVGGVWGILVYPISFMIGLVFYWEKSVPTIIEWILAIVLNLPNTLIAIFLPEQEILQFVEHNPISIVLLLLSNFFGWILIGATIGYLYGRRKGN